MENLPTSPPPSHQRMKLNIGGTLFETTPATLRSSSSLLSLSSNPIFIDRDPQLFSTLLSLLRTHRLSSSSSSRHQLLHESLFYGLQHHSLSPPPLSPFDASLAYSLSPPSDPFISALSFSEPHSSLLLVHNGVVSSYRSSLSSPTLSLSSRTRTHLDIISSIRNVSDSIAVLGSELSPGLHFYSTEKHAGSAHWVDPTDPRTHKAHITAIANVSEARNTVFASFECWHGENAILAVDSETMKVASEIGRQSGSAAKSSAMSKLTWVPSSGLLIGSSVKCGALGYSGYIRAWDPRAGGNEVWETSEPGGSGRVSRSGDTMADVDVDPDGGFIAKVGCRTGDVGVADLRKLEPDPWVYLEDPNPRMREGGVSGKSVVVCCYRKHVFVGKEGGLEAWSSLKKKQEEEEEGEEREWGLYRRNYVDKEEDEKRGAITKIESGGNRLFVCRENVEGVEVWESSDFSGAKVIL